MISSLSKKEVKSFLKIVNDTSTYGMPPLSCSTFDFAVIFYKSNRILHSISLSTSCDNLVSSLPIKANEQKKMSYGQIDDYLYSCFTAEGKKKIVKFLNKKGAKIKYEYRTN